jgi:glycerol-1-phosphate dehydrogenase [NAD(P)+]
MGHEQVDAALRDATDTEQVVIGAHTLAGIDELFQKTFGDRRAVVVADGNTWTVAGETVQQRLEEAGRSLEEPYIFPGSPTLYADYENIKKLIASLQGHDAIPVAIGSGTLNDIVKRAAHECERPYLCVGTAASMDGYTAFGAAITKEGYKQTMTCPAPRAVLGDLDVLATAPPKMTAAGYADLLAKITAGADWLVADALGVEKIDPKVWALVQHPLREATAQPAQLRAGELPPLEALIEGLVMSGLAMQAAASSRPASGAEHQFSHLWEMEGLGQHPPEGQPPLSHGFKVGLGTVSIAALYERVLERDLGALDVDAAVAAWPSWEEIERRVRASHTQPGLDEAAVAESKAKYVDADALADRLRRLAEVWPELREKLRAQLMPAAQIRDQLLAAGCPTTPLDVELTPQRFKATYTRAQMIRRRYTVLDVLLETGLLEECVEELFAGDGYWARELGAVH